MTICRLFLVLGASTLPVWPARTQVPVDTSLANRYFAEAAVLCARDAGRLWGHTLCGPMVLADPATHAVMTNVTRPNAKLPPTIGFANAALEWGSQRWSTYAWQLIPQDSAARVRLLMHELFHRIQPALGFLAVDASNDHLDTPDGRYWLELEWRALSKALTSANVRTALGDALAFRARRHALFPGAAESERTLEMNEGLAEYTGIVTTTASRAEAVAVIVRRLESTPNAETFVRAFAYANGGAYALLLDSLSPRWRSRLRAVDDLAKLVIASSGIAPASDEANAEIRFGGAALRHSEADRETRRQVKLAELRALFVEGPVLALPGSHNNSFTSGGITPLPGVGRVIPQFRGSAEWGTIEATTVLMSADRSQLAVSARGMIVTGQTVKGDGWTLALAEGWSVTAGARRGDFAVRQTP